MPIDYLQMLRQLVRERESWVRQRDDAMRELSRLSELIRSTIKMLPDEQRSRCDALLERIDNRPAGLTTAIRLVFTAGHQWLSPVEIREQLKSNGFNFEAYRANPLASIHATLKRMVPEEMECRRVEGKKIYRLKTASEWSAALKEARDWLAGRKYLAVGRGPWLPALQNEDKKRSRKAGPGGREKT